MLLANAEPLVRCKAVDAALDIEQDVDTSLTVSSAIGEIAAAFLPRRALAAMSARSKNCRLAWAQHSADVIGPRARDAS